MIRRFERVRCFDNMNNKIVHRTEGPAEAKQCSSRFRPRSESADKVLPSVLL
jgi:hypothetical protein